jgi:diguanylate cyclase (GGDEF)-like protein
MPPCKTCRRMSLAIFFLGSLFCTRGMAYSQFVTALPRPTSGGVAPLTQVAQVRKLNQEEAARSVPIRIQGIVTDLPGYKNSFFLQDGTGGISVDRTDTEEVRAGDRVEVTGATNPGLFAPSLMASRVSLLGHGPPPAPTHVSYDDMVGGALDSRWIEVHGVVRSARISKTFEDDVMILVVNLGGGSTRVILQDYAGIDSIHLIDSTVRIRGVCTSNFNDKRQFVGLEMYVPDRRNLTIMRAAADDPFSSTVTPVRNALQFGQSQHRIKISGVASYQIPGHALYLQDGSDGIAVQDSTSRSIAPGTKVEAVGFPAMGDYAPILEDGIVRSVGHAEPPKPLRTDAKNVIVSTEGIKGKTVGDFAPYDEQLLQLRARVVENNIQGNQRVWILRQEGVIFEAYLPLADSDDRTANIPTGSVLSVTGICRVHADPERTPTSFSILVRSPQDIVVLEHGPWWTPARTLSLVAGLALLAVLVILWVLVLRKRVEQQTRTIRESEGRFRYLAEHDELTGLLNRRAVLLALEREIARASRGNTEVTIVLCDLDHFKQVNDVHGHLGGDAALRRFASALSESMRPYDTAGRYGGEEFLLVLSGINSADVQDRLAVLHDAISNLVVRDRQEEFRITCSLGAVLVASGECEVDQEVALAAADQALYEAKETGRNRVVLHSGLFA